MSGIRGNSEDVRFDFEAADRLAVRFRSTAQQLESQIGWRNALAGVARQEWRGRYAEGFDVRMGLCTDGARALAQSMRNAAATVDELVRLAHEEQSRRIQARQWFEDQKSSNPLTWLWDRFEDWWSGPDVPAHLQPGPLLAATVPFEHHIAVNRE